MKMNDILREDVMILDLKATSKEAVLDEMITILAQDGAISDVATFKAAILKREAEGTTGIGDGIAIPHGKSIAVTKPTVVFGRSVKGIDFASLDGQPAQLFFMIAAPADSADEHLKILSNLSVQLMKPEVRDALVHATTTKEVQAAFAPVEMETENVVSGDAPFVVAVTGCATGIAHTFMAAEKLREVANQMGVEIKVETNGSTGVEHRLTTKDIERAQGVIVAADINVEMGRFNGKHLVSVKVAEGIKNAKGLIEKALSGTAPVYHGAEEAEQTSDSSNDSIGQQVYKHLMSGVSHMLPFVIGGGIAIALSFMIDQMIGVPQDALGQLGSYNTIAAHFNTIGGYAFGFMLPVLAGYIAYSIADRPGLVAGFVAGAAASAGGAGFLGALVGGFIAGYFVVWLKQMFKNLPKSFDGIKTILFYPVLGVIVVGFMMLLVNIPMSALNTAMNNFLENLSGTNAVLLGALLAGMMAIDLGGPINKAAYVFGTGTLAASIATGGSAVMAAVMAGGMVPPLAIFIATRVFPKKFTAAERDAGITNLIMGLSFITEGAIPFAASNPLRFLPGFVVGSAVTGALTMALNIKVMAPHGGVFVLPLVSSPILYLLFIVIGSVVSAGIIGMMKVKTDEK